MKKVTRHTLRFGMVLGVLGLIGCTATSPQSTVSRNLDSGVTASNGGGMAPSGFGNVGVSATPAARTTP